MLWARDEEYPADVVRVGVPPEVAGRKFVIDAGVPVVGRPAVAAAAELAQVVVEPEKVGEPEVAGSNWQGVAAAAVWVVEQVLVDKGPGLLIGSWDMVRKLPTS